MTYKPEVNDYVIWERHGLLDEGWVYFKGDVPVHKRGFPDKPRYITIETGVRDKPDCVYTSGKPMRHKMIHTLLLCNEECWHQLKYVKHRRTREILHYSQYDDINQEKELANEYKGTYKSQQGRLQDY